MFLWAQPSAPGFGADECQSGLATSNPSCSPDMATKQAQEHSLHKSSTPTINNAPGFFPFNLQWSALRLNQLPDQMEEVYDSLLQRAQTEANADRLEEAVTTASGIPKNSRHYAVAQRLQEDWSQALLQRATDRCQQGDMGTALTMLNAIPPTSHQQARVNELQTAWGRQATVLEQAKAARAQGDWQTVIAKLESLQGTLVYNSLPVQELLQQAIRNHLQPDEALMRMASVTPEPQEARATYRTAIPTTTAVAQAAVDPLPASPRLGIGLSQAIAWAQPPAEPQATPATSRDVVVASNQLASANVPAKQSAVSTPDAIAMTPEISAKPPKDIKARDLAGLPRPNPLVTAEPVMMAPVN
jgi:hypothetical protein